jgi:protein TonB
VDILKGDHRDKIYEFGDTNSSFKPTMPPASVDDDDIYAFYHVMKKPGIVFKAKPTYPHIALDAGIEGRVITIIEIDTNGIVARASIYKSIPLLDEAALEAAKLFIFKPAMQNGLPVKVRMFIPFNFKLDDKHKNKVPDYYTFIPSDTSGVFTFNNHKFKRILIYDNSVLIEKGFNLEQAIDIVYASDEHFELLYNYPDLMTFAISYKSWGLSVNNNWYYIHE